MGRTMALWANYGALGHEGEAVWRRVPLDEAADAERHVVELPDGHSLIEAEDAGGADLIEHDGERYRLAEPLPLTATGELPRLMWPDGTARGHVMEMREVTT